ncbi:MAG: hypothetical protein RI964_594 [Pseudomonadota bacterium]|jgi:transglutaminase-like putative cysteine protease
MPKQVTYSGMIWLLGAQLLVMLPFAFSLPVWLIPVLVLSTWWRLRVLSGKVAQPSQAAKLVVMALGVGGLLLSGLQFPSLDAMSALLLLGFAFKALEVVHRRDALVVVFVGYFLIALQFLYSQSMGAALYGVLSLTVLTAALIGVQFPVAEWTAAQNVRQNLRLSVFMLLQCLPLMVIIFVFAPRLQPLWTLPLMQGQTKTGISDRMAPGDIESLSQSDDLAFRVTFKGARPPQNQLYWRGLVLNHFDGKTWQQFAQAYETWELKNQLTHLYAFNRDQLQIKGLPLEYEVVYEKTAQPWLFTLTPPVQAQGDVIFGADYRIMANQDLQTPLLLKVVSYPDAIRDTQLSPAMRQLALQLPAEGDERSHALARELRQQAGNEAAYVDAVLHHFRQQQFVYTLRPPNMGETNTIDSFLFEAQRGFCAHYAGSFVYLMRVAGIPARVVIGYQGGEWNAQDQYLTVRQYDAHAWAEVWLAGKGWVQVDPTTAVAPERVEKGLEAAVKAEGTFLANQRFSTRNVQWLNTVRQQLDATQYGWQRWVLGYDGDAQRSFLAKLLGEFSVVRLVILVGGLLALVTLFWMLALGLARRREREALEHQLYRRFCAVLAKRGVVRDSGQAPSVFAQQAANALPQQAAVIQEFTAVYEGLCYEPEADVKSALRRLQALLGRL